MKKLLLLSFVLLCSMRLLAQSGYIPAYLQNADTFITNNFEIVDSSGWLHALPESNIMFDNNLFSNMHYLGMGADDNFRIRNIEVDTQDFIPVKKRGYIHARLNQTYKDVDVEFAELLIHADKDARVELISSKLAEGLDMSVVPTLTEAQALTAAINYLGDTNVYSWQDTAFLAGYRDMKEDSTATTYPIGELLIAKLQTDPNYDASQFRLAWKFSIYSIDPDIQTIIYIDANTGSVVKQKSTIDEGAAQLMYGYGTNQYIDTRWRGGLYNHYVLRSDDANEPKIWTKKWGGSAKFGGYDCLGLGGCTLNSFDGDDNWGIDRAIETTTHWAATRAWNYFKNIFSRNGCNGEGAELCILTNDTMTNAVWNRDYKYMRIGSISGNYLGTKDVISHEYTHAIIQHTAALDDTKEPGALGESFADIFGYEVERYINGGVHTNWTCGEDAITLRNMSNPSAFNQPSVYGGAYWYNTVGCTPYEVNDKCGVHGNAAVQNYWFYLLTSGSANAPDGTYDNIPVSGIGADKARDIAYLNMTRYLLSNSNYQDAKTGSIFAAMHLFGNCTNELTQVINAWAAVGLGAERKPLTVSGPDYVYYYGSTGNIVGTMPKFYTATGGNVARYIWSNPNGAWTSSVTTNTGIPLWSFDNTYNITNFNNNFTNTTLSVSDRCTTVSKPVRFGNWETIIDISPNPATAIMNVSFDTDEIDVNTPVTYFVTDGFALYTAPPLGGNSSSNDFSIDVSSLSPGVYYFVFEFGEKSGSKAFIKL